MTATIVLGRNYSSATRVKVIRKTVGLTVRQDLLEKARDSDINLSKLLESSLIQLLEPKTNTQFQETPFLGTASFGKEGVVGRAGLEPTTLCTSSRCPTKLDDRPLLLHG
jgi:post-segregation antitoxin (ccd killing protein)